jgi:adenine-specific DNA-methyltransferase
MMYPRLFLARQLLREDGVIFVSIDDHEVHNLRQLMGEVFGEENYRNTLLIRRYDKNLNRQFMESGLVTLNVGAEYVIVYARSSSFYLNPVCRAASEQRQNYGYWKGFWNAPDRPTMRYELLGSILNLGTVGKFDFAGTAPEKQGPERRLSPTLRVKTAFRR